MKNIILSIFIGLILFGLALGLSIWLLDDIHKPLEEIVSSSGYVFTSKMEALGGKILQVTGALFIWTALTQVGRLIIKDLLT